MPNFPFVLDRKRAKRNRFSLVFRFCLAVTTADWRQFVFSSSPFSLCFFGQRNPTLSSHVSGVCCEAHMWVPAFLCVFISAIVVSIFFVAVVFFLPFLDLQTYFTPVCIICNRFFLALAPLLSLFTFSRAFFKANRNRNNVNKQLDEGKKHRVG